MKAHPLSLCLLASRAGSCVDQLLQSMHTGSVFQNTNHGVACAICADVQLHDDILRDRVLQPAESVSAGLLRPGAGLCTVGAHARRECGARTCRCIAWAVKGQGL
jgi:hypothetical protein